MGKPPCNPKYVTIKQDSYCVSCKRTSEWVCHLNTNLGFSHSSISRCYHCESANVYKRRHVLMKGDKLEANERIICAKCANWEALNGQFVAGRILSDCFLDWQGCTVCHICRTYQHLADIRPIRLGRVAPIEYRAVTIPNNLAVVADDQISVDIAHV